METQILPERNDLSYNELAKKVGGYYELITIINLRLRELREKAKPLVETTSTRLEDIVREEIAAGKLSLRYLENKESEEEE